MADILLEEEESETDKINVVPLADLSLVLLIVLMVLSPMVMASMIRVQAPSVKKVRSAPKTPAKTPDPLLIKITPTAVFLNNNPVDNDQFLAEQIAIKLQREPTRPVIISAEDDVEVGRVVSYLDLAKQSGAESVSLLKGGPGA